MLGFKPGRETEIGMSRKLYISEDAIISNTSTKGYPVFQKGVFNALKTITTSEQLGIQLMGGNTQLTEYVQQTLLNESIAVETILSNSELNEASVNSNDILVVTDDMLKENADFIQIVLDAKRENTEVKSDKLVLAKDWNDCIGYIISERRIGEVERNTYETKIHVKVDLDGRGKSEISTGLGFFDHMLEQIAKHGNVGLMIKVDGDLQVDEHHTIEDTAIALGEALTMAVGSKLGMERYGYALPMDDCAAQVLMDFGGRPWLVWDAEFNREKIGDMPTEMFYHFFKSLADASKCNLNIKVEGTNEHHKIEGIFKAYARALKMAIQRNYNQMILPTTKGLL